MLSCEVVNSTGTIESNAIYRLLVDPYSSVYVVCRMRLYSWAKLEMRQNVAESRNKYSTMQRGEVLICYESGFPLRALRVEPSHSNFPSLMREPLPRPVDHEET